MFSDSLHRLVHEGSRKMSLRLLLLAALYMLVVSLAANHDGAQRLVSVHGLHCFDQNSHRLRNGA